MLEILFIFGALGWLVGGAWEYLSALAAFPTILTALAAVPLMAGADYLTTVHRLELHGLNQARVPVPPERFYWAIYKSDLQRNLWWSGVLAVLGWAAAIEWPADFTGEPSSFIGWVSGAVAITATARFVAHGVIYVRASQWFDQMAPWAVGFCRRTMYRLSDNPDFLDSADPKRREKEKSIY